MLYGLLACCSLWLFSFSVHLLNKYGLRYSFDVIRKGQWKHTNNEEQNKKDCPFHLSPTHSSTVSVVFLFLRFFFPSLELRGSIFPHKIRVWYLPHFSINNFSSFFHFSIRFQSSIDSYAQCTNTHLVPIGNLISFVATNNDSGGNKKKSMHKFSMWISFH